MHTMSNLERRLLVLSLSLPLPRGGVRLPVLDRRRRLLSRLRLLLRLLLRSLTPLHVQLILFLSGAVVPHEHSTDEIYKMDSTLFQSISQRLKTYIVSTDVNRSLTPLTLRDLRLARRPWY